MKGWFVSFGAGLFTWTLMEYGVHEVLGHRPKGKTHASREHLAHHKDTSYFTPYAKKFLAATPIVGTLGAGAAALVGPGRGIAYAAGVATGWAWYEVGHRRIHQRPPTTAYGRWMRRHHLHHHFGHPRANHGVVTSLWDHVFGTYQRPEQIRVPRRNVGELPWITGGDPEGEVLPEHADGYRVV
ncbi:MAG: sterol desaturase family protein [Myxococcota bacterium]